MLKHLGRPGARRQELLATGLGPDSECREGVASAPAQPNRKACRALASRCGFLLRAEAVPELVRPAVQMCRDRINREERGGCFRDRGGQATRPKLESRAGKTEREEA